MLKFIKPDYKVDEYIENNYYGKFVLEPLERGFGTTIGNALRRVMLSSLEGSAVTDCKIEGVMHEFQKIDGVVEDVTEIILNLKKLVVKLYRDKQEFDEVINESNKAYELIEKNKDDLKNLNNLFKRLYGNEKIINGNEKIIENQLKLTLEQCGIRDADHLCSQNSMPNIFFSISIISFMIS